MKSDFNTITKAELHAYITTHLDDDNALQALVDDFAIDASPDSFELPQPQTENKAVETLFQQRVQSLFPHGRA